MKAIIEDASEVSESADRSGVKSLGKALGLLEAVALAERPPTVAEAAMSAGIARPTAYRLVESLVAQGYLSQDIADGRLTVGFSVLPLAASLLDGNRMRVEALPHLQSLAERTGERVNLGILYRYRLLYLAGIEKPSLPVVYSRFGKTAPVHCCSLGKAILAHMPEPQVRTLLQRTGLEGMTANTITTVETFLEELNQIRNQGFAVDREEHFRGSFCVAATVFDAQNRPVGAIGLSSRALAPLLAETDNLRHTAEVITHLL